MKRAALVTELTVTYPVFTPGGTSGTVYNGVVLASTVAAAASPDGATEGKGIDASNYYRALITVAAGTVAGDNTITVLVGPKGYAADDATYPAVEVPNFELNIGAAQSGLVVVGELFMQAVTVPESYPNANSLWIKKTGTDTAMAVTVLLDDPSREIADGRNTLQADAVFTG